MSDYDELKAAVRSAVNERDSCIEPNYEVAVNTHFDGPALGIWIDRNGESVVPDKVPLGIDLPFPWDESDSGPLHVTTP